MGLVIWKQPLDVVASQTVVVPVSAVPLSVAFQGEFLVLWMLVDPDQRRTAQEILIYSTGAPVREDILAVADHVGTVQNPKLAGAWHVWWVVFDLPNGEGNGNSEVA